MAENTCPNPESMRPVGEETNSAAQTSAQEQLHVVLLEQLRPTHRLQSLNGYSAPRLYHWGLTLTPDIAFIRNVEDRARLAGSGMSWLLDGSPCQVLFHYTDGYISPRASNGRGGLRSGQPKLGVPVWSVVALGDAPLQSFNSRRLRRLPLSVLWKEGAPTTYADPHAHGPAKKLFDCNKSDLTPEFLRGLQVFLTQVQISASNRAAARKAAREVATRRKAEARASSKALKAEKKRARAEAASTRKLLALRKRQRAQKKNAESKKRAAAQAARRKAKEQKRLLDDQQHRLLEEKIREQVRAEIIAETRAKALVEARENRLADQVRENIRAELEEELRSKNKARAELEEKIRRESAAGNSYSSPSFVKPTNPYGTPFRPPTPMPSTIHTPMFAPPPPTGLVRYNTPPLNLYGPGSYGRYMF